MKKLPYLLGEWIILICIAGCSVSPSSINNSKTSVLNRIYSVWQKHMDADCGSLTQNTEWTIGDETYQSGMYMEFFHNASGFSFTADIYNSSVNDADKPYERISISDSGDFLIIDNDEVGFQFQQPLNESPSLSQFFEQIGEMPDASDIESAETLKQDGNTVYRLIFTPEYCRLQSSEAGQASSVLYSKIVELTLTPDDSIKTLTYSTEGAIQEGKGDESRETPVSMNTQFLFDFDI